ncbi:MAG: hypothetical protein QCI00_03460 [Candidatus Thermoplasmatota archaeon]|nr:hypothetical protein [Candidatus Thermoplasmatota archaeon]
MIKKQHMLFKGTFVFFLLVSIQFLSGCIDDYQGIESIPETAEILLLSNRDTGDNRKEIYSLDLNESSLKRITYSNVHHFLIGIDSQKRYIVAARAVDDTHMPKGLGDEDDKSLWVIDLQTGEELRLNEEGTIAEGKSFSSDSEWIVFWMQKNASIASNIYKTRKDGSELTQLTNTTDSFEFDPVWSKDGESIVFTCYNHNIGRSVLKKMDAEGSNVIFVYDGGEGVTTLLFPPGNYDPSWSPDGNWIVFDRTVRFNEEIGGENGGAGVWHIFKVRSDGTDVLNLSKENNQQNAANYLPSFSSNGSQIVFSSRYGMADPKIVKIDLFLIDDHGGSLRKLTNSENSIYYDMGIWLD